MTKSVHSERPIPLEGLLTQKAQIQLGRLVRGARPGDIPRGGVIPKEVHYLAVRHGWSLPRAWREYLWLSKAEVAKRAKINVDTYHALESNFASVSKEIKIFIASLLGLSAEQLG
ncbi:helix-turn-helix domain-containing protein [Bordetella sp. 02P26C-1]|uniref:helix-turn-helix domain-containing protein n=1 Tax=Bordetella sp. 02P26C-1 TaxID=2683195 RepID=UPI001354CE34|nr:helix-turn-helix transcriptional regulator [Bordetella sp. 02P26C-1]MVW79070.1 XRE family transcriptional regulator [Bordetella sp. 02P26C-1]